MQSGGEVVSVGAGVLVLGVAVGSVVAVLVAVVVGSLVGLVGDGVPARQSS
jgi:hypothetical protein